MNEKTYVDASPSAASLIEGLRDFGYTFETSMADIVDNSITAEATEIDIYSEFNNGDKIIAFVDNGRGMSYEELIDAMKPGSRSPLSHREKGDLGRFGLGLKTASFAHARQLTVVSKRNGIVSAARWDLDDVAKSDRWEVEVLGEEVAIPFEEKLASKTGTLVLWGKLDRLGDSQDQEKDYRTFNSAVSDSMSHLALVFHRFLQGDGSFKKITMRVNNSPIEPIDPFNSRNSKTQQRDEMKIPFRQSMVNVRAFTLPHHGAVDKNEWEKYAGKEGYTRNQGFYLYRSGRLIMRGTWFGLVRQQQQTRLTRIRIDIDNSYDKEWKINVLKASAEPPRVVREQLKTVVNNLGFPSVRTYTKRARLLISPYKYPFWLRQISDDQISYLINRENPMLEELIDGASVGTQERIEKLLTLLERDVPLDSIFIDLADSPERIKIDEFSDSDALEIGRFFARQMIAENMAIDRILLELRTMPILIGKATVVDEIRMEIEGEINENN
jgi:hypothetical protein